LNNTAIGAIAGISLVLIIAFVFALFPAQSDDTIFFIQKDGSTPEPCTGNVGLVLAQNLTDLCDVTIISPTTNQLIQYNGSQWVNVDTAFITTNATCSNLGTGGEILCANDANNILSFKRLVEFGTGIDLDSNATHIFITNNEPESSKCLDAYTPLDGGNLCFNNTFNGGDITVKGLDAGNGITMVNDTEKILIINSKPEITQCNNSTGGFGICIDDTITLRNLVAGTSISLSSNATHITITNTVPDNTVCANVGTGTIIYKDGECNFKTLVGSPDISVTNTTNTVVIDYNGTHVTSVTSNNNSTLGVVPTTGAIVLYPKYELLCQATLGSNADSLSCNNFSARKFLRIELVALTGNNGTTIVTGLRFNGNNSAVYAWRLSNNGGADSTSVSTNQCQLLGLNAVANNGGSLQVMNVINISTYKKLVIGFADDQMSDSAGTAPRKTEMGCKWDNSSQITSVSLIRASGTSAYISGTEITVWGYN